VRERLRAASYKESRAWLRAEQMMEAGLLQVRATS